MARGDIVVRLIGDTKELDKAFSSVGGKLSGGVKQIASELDSLGFGGGSLGALGGAVFGLGGAVAIVGALKQVADKTAEYAGEVRSLKGVTGSSAEDASRLVAQLHALGIETSAASKPLLTLSENIRKGGSGLKDYFSSAEIARFRTQDLSKTLPELADKFQSLDSPIEKNGLAVAAFGKRGIDLKKVLSATGEELSSFAKNAERAGLVFSDKALDDARKYQIAMRELGATFEGLEVQVGKVAIPALTNVADYINDGILKVEDYGHRVTSVFEKLPGPIQKGLGDFAKGVASNLPGIGVLFRDVGNDAEKATKKIVQSFDGVSISAADTEEASKKFGESLKAAFEISGKAAQEFEKRLDKFVPKLGEDFAEAGVKSEQALKSTLETNLNQLKGFNNDLEVLGTRLGRVAEENIVGTFLSHLQELGPGALPLLRSLATTSDTELGKLASIFGENIKEAKVAADLQLDKYPPNFAEKLSATRKAAVGELAKIVGDFKALPDSVDPGGAWAGKLQSMADAIKVLDKQGKISLSSVQRGFLESADNAETAGEKAKALQKFIDSMHGKKLDFLLNFKTAGLGSSSTDLVIANNPDLFRAKGGPVSAGQPYWVGEDGPEVFVPPSDGRVLSSAQSTRRGTSGTGSTAAGTGGMGSRNYNITVNVPPTANKAEVGAAVVETIREYERRSGSGWRAA